MRSVLRGTLAIVVLVCGGAVQPSAQITPAVPITDQTLTSMQDLVATQVFETRVRQYVRLHRVLEGPLPPMRSTTEMDDIRATMHALARRIQAARARENQGEIITPDVARMFRRRIATCLPPEEWAAVFADIDVDEAGVSVAPPALRVNMEWPHEVPFNDVPSQLLLALPPLPSELQYRIIGRSLVLWDHHANLIVDFLPAAFMT